MIQKRPWNVSCAWGVPETTCHGFDRVVRDGEMCVGRGERRPALAEALKLKVAHIAIGLVGLSALAL